MRRMTWPVASAMGHLRQRNSRMLWTGPGLFQINAVVPAGLPANAATSIGMKVSDFPAPAGITVAVR